MHRFSNKPSTFAKSVRNRCSPLWHASTVAIYKEVVADSRLVVLPFEGVKPYLSARLLCRIVISTTPTKIHINRPTTTSTTTIIPKEPSNGDACTSEVTPSSNWDDTVVCIELETPDAPVVVTSPCNKS